ncbi:hypothetical protein BJ138DRAFT_1145130 [Hygrophoropsis aurantiaca]|uniref:Uncharacterized protein n=1 Tax=Hygrophoropsis aurantiaca TaxID=72124 RepID=A0ACB8AL04_9AGAM|nr:hypothetical protein BJ138DRAFT_1145130 [Hygrophoropsis aurantiaca]
MNSSASSSSSSSSRTLYSPPSAGGTASRFLFSMRKSFSYTNPQKRKQDESSHPHGGMYSTPEEGSPCIPLPARSRFVDPSASRPTIEQIAMGLHISRTPHLRPSTSPHPRYSSPSSPSRHNLNMNVSHPRPAPPPPSRSSLKKTYTPSSSLITTPKSSALLGVSPSTSTVASTGPVTPASSVQSLKLRMAKFIPGYRSPSSSSLSGSGRPMTPRKAVRFSTSVLALDEVESDS